jgi:hypothetical protein
MQFRTIPGYSAYEISSDGETIRRVTDSARNGYKAGHVVKQYSDRYGYKAVKLIDDEGKKKNLFVHRLVAASFIGDPAGKDINHKDGIKTNNTVQNLEIVSPQENMTHSVEVLGNKHCAVGERNRHAKLKASDIPVIRERRIRGETLQSIADDYGLHHATISQICSGKRWQHVVKARE